jgi:hypothetical protein
MNEYNIALTWLTRSEYDVKTVLVGKNVKIELWQGNTLIKFDTIPFDTSFVSKVHAKIITLYNHFKK